MRQDREKTPSEFATKGAGKRASEGLFHGLVLQLRFATWQALYLQDFGEWCKTCPFVKPILFRAMAKPVESV
jgi:hypothetical protein